MTFCRGSRRDVFGFARFSVYTLNFPEASQQLFTSAGIVPTEVAHTARLVLEINQTVADKKHGIFSVPVDKIDTPSINKMFKAPVKRLGTAMFYRSAPCLDERSFAFDRFVMLQLFLHARYLTRLNLTPELYISIGQLLEDFHIF